MVPGSVSVPPVRPPVISVTAAAERFRQRGSLPALLGGLRRAEPAAG